MLKTSVALALLLLAQGALATRVPLQLPLTFIVNSASDAHDSDPGDGICANTVGKEPICTLRAAVDQLNTSGGGAIQVPAYDIQLGLGEIVISTGITITGAGMHATTIRRHPQANAARILRVVAGSYIVELTDLTVRDGIVFNAGGGAIFCESPAELRIQRCVVSGSTATNGGCVFATGLVSVTDSQLTDCHASGPITGDNGIGGAVWLSAANVFAGLYVSGSTLNGNVAAGKGGAIYIAGRFGMTNTTLSGNHAGGYGGGMHVASGSGISQYLTITDNYSDTQGGGGGASNASPDSVQFHNTLLAGNYQASGQFLVDGDCAGVFTATGSVIVGPDGKEFCTIGGTTGWPLFGPLQDNGGLTPTHALLAGSPGIDSAGGGHATSLVDQRMSTRFIDDPSAGNSEFTLSDAGAYERTPCGDSNGDGSINVLDVLAMINYLFAGGPKPAGLANVNGDSFLNVGDVLFMINHLFAGGSAPACPGT